MAQYTLSVIKADTGSIGGHTKPSLGMMSTAKDHMVTAQGDGLIVSSRVMYTGDDIALHMVHTRGKGDSDIFNLAWDTFEATSKVAENEGLYAWGQDLHEGASSGNNRGAGPGVAEVVLEGFGTDIRPAEAVMVFAADKCGPGVFNAWFRQILANPDWNSGLVLVPDLRAGFDVDVIDMHPDMKGRKARYRLPEEHLELAFVLRDSDRYAIAEVYSRANGLPMISVATSRLHNITGKYEGKDDPVAIFRVQKIFPAPEEVSNTFARFINITTGDCRGSHNAPMMPVKLNTAVTGPYCQPIVSCAGYSINRQGLISEVVDHFSGASWKPVRKRAARAMDLLRDLGFNGVALASGVELAYQKGLRTLEEDVEKRFLTA